MMETPPSALLARRFPAARVTPNAAHALGGIWRLTARRFASPTRWLVLAGMLGALVVFSVPAAPSREAAVHGFLPWAVRFYLCFLVPLLAFIFGAGAMRDDLQPDSVDYVFTRPIRRPLYIVFRYLAHMICAQIDFLLALLVVVGIGIYRDVPTLGAAVPWLVFSQILVVAAFTAFGFLCGLLTSRYMIVGLLYGSIVEFGFGNVPTQLNQISLLRQVLGMLSPVMGDAGEGIGGPAIAAALGTSGTITMLLGYPVVMVAITAAWFSTKELVSATGREP